MEITKTKIWSIFNKFIKRTSNQKILLQNCKFKQKIQLLFLVVNLRIFKLVKLKNALNDKYFFYLKFNFYYLLNTLN